jgi:hypothetical protein
MALGITDFNLLPCTLFRYRVLTKLILILNFDELCCFSGRDASATTGGVRRAKASPHEKEQQLMIL